jgi:hypothetical protein
LWSSGAVEPAAASETRQALLWIGYFYGSGALIAFFAGLAQGFASRRTAPLEREVVAAEDDGRGEVVETRERHVTYLP